MNFRIIEADYLNWDSICDDFSYDFLFSPLKNTELKSKYGLTQGEFNECCKNVLEANNLTRRPHYRERAGKSNYFYKTKYAVVIQKKVNGVQHYIGSVPTVDVALKIVELCKKASWNIDVCREMCARWKDYVK